MQSDKDENYDSNGYNSINFTVYKKIENVL